MDKKAFQFLRKNWPYIFAVIILIFLPNILSDFRLNLLGKFLTFAIAAIAIDLLWGYTGILSLGRAY